MSTIKRSSREIIKNDLDKEFIAFINFLNESIKEFYLSTENNCREINIALDLFQPIFNNIISLLNGNNNQHQKEAIIENINKCESICNQIKLNSKLNHDNLHLFFEDAKMLFGKLREKRKETLHVPPNFSTKDKDRFNKYITLASYNKLNTYILQLQDYNEIISKFSEKAKYNFINLQKMILDTLNEDIKNSKQTKKNLNLVRINTDNNFGNNLRLDTEIEKVEKNLDQTDGDGSLIDKTKKINQFKKKYELELIPGNNENINLLKNNDITQDKKNFNLIDTNKYVNTEILKLKTDLDKLDQENIQLKKDLLRKERQISLLKIDSNKKTQKNSAGSGADLKKNIGYLSKENNELKEKIKIINSKEDHNNINEYELDSLNKKIEYLSQLLTKKMNNIILLEKENINLKASLGKEKNKLIASQRSMYTLNNNPNNINYFEYTLLEENKKLKSINDNSRNILTKLSNENKNLKSQIKLLETDNNYIINIQKEMDQLINLIKENNITFNNDKINIEFEQKINNLQNILNNKEASLQNYEIQNNNNMDVNILIKEVKDKDKIIYELKNKIMNSEKQIRLLNQKLKNSNTNNNKLISQENHNLNIKLVDMEKENQVYKNKLEEMVKQINNIKKSDNGNNNSQEVINMANKTKNLEFKINQLNQEIFQLKKEKDILELTNNNLLSEIEKINQNKTSQNQNTNDIDISSAIKKKEEEIEGLNAFIQKLTKQSEKYSEDIETYKIKINSLQKENTSIKKQLERLTIEMPKELNALKIQLDEANKKLSENNNDFSNNKTTNSINKSNTKNKEKLNKAFDEGMQKEIENNMVTKLNKEISDLKNKNKELLFKLEDKEINILNSGYKTDEQNMSGYEEEFDLRKMATGARDKNRSEDINIDYPGLQNYKEKLNELQFKFNNLKEQIKILLSKIKCTNIIKPTFVQICQLLGYKSIDIEKMVSSEKEKKKILGV